MQVSLSSSGHRTTPVHFEDIDLKKAGYDPWVRPFAYAVALGETFCLCSDIGCGSPAFLTQVEACTSTFSAADTKIAVIPLPLPRVHPSQSLHVSIHAQVSYGQSKTANIYLATEIDRRYGPQGKCSAGS